MERICEMSAYAAIRKLSFACWLSKVHKSCSKVVQVIVAELWPMRDIMSEQTPRAEVWSLGKPTHNPSRSSRPISGLILGFLPFHGGEIESILSTRLRMLPTGSVTAAAVAVARTLAIDVEDHQVAQFRHESPSKRAKQRVSTIGRLQYPPWELCLQNHGSLLEMCNPRSMIEKPCSLSFAI